jgi:hypothetical protein
MRGLEIRRSRPSFGDRAHEHMGGSTAAALILDERPMLF